MPEATGGTCVPCEYLLPDGSREYTAVRDFKCVGLHFGDANGWEEAEGIFDSNGIQALVSCARQLANRTIKENHSVFVSSGAFQLNAATMSAPGAGTKGHAVPAI